MKDYLKLMRCKHYLKNILIFFPLFFSKNIFNINITLKTILGFIIFCLVASIVYIFNDIMDVEKDKLHPKKKLRPIAAGKIKIKNAYVLLISLSLIIIFLSVLVFKESIALYLILLFYIFINLMYSIKFKNVPILDIVILCIGFIIRVLYGAVLANVIVSNWLYLTILSLAFYMALGKRKNELLNLDTDKTRNVLKYYNQPFLENNMYMFLGLAIVFYSLWCIDMSVVIGSNIILSVFIVMIICMRYSYKIEQKNSMGDPIEVIIEDKTLICLCIIFAITLGILIYI